ncbi:hypothetical protein COUCH_19960 [Couchioplanes caeruleus]|uniref:hypothetical protein n=1 Tax=Couchioplanes caeruleus TaxID=56438 RepID=UPI0020BF0AA0|nr:hypothetical protein [Couchioplanes caeruleus]UQU61340.1 hypothetical protein COUCH_19960 [Couchioplanes caeruleus]
MHRSSGGWARLSATAGMSSVLTLLGAVLVNVVTDGWNPVLVAVLLAFAGGYVVFDVWKARESAREAHGALEEAEALAAGAREIATKATSRLMVAVDDVLNPLFVQMDRAADTSLTYSARMQQIGIAYELIFGGLRRLITADVRVRTTYYTLHKRPVRSLRLWSSSGRRGTVPSEFTEDDPAGRVLLRILDRGVVHQDRPAHGYEGLAEITADHPILAVAPVWSSGDPVGILLIDAPAYSEIAGDDLLLVDLFAKLLGLLHHRSTRAPGMEGDEG